MGMRSFSHSFGAGDIKEFRCGGYFTIASASDEVDIEIFESRGNSIGVLQNVGAGFWLKDKDVDYIKVTSASAQTVNIISGSSDVGVNKTTTSINGGTLDPQTLDTSYLGTFTASLDTIVTPAANVAGIRIDGVNFTYIAGTNGFGRIMFKTSAPSGMNDGSGLLYVSNYYTQTRFDVDKIECPIIIPAGNGLYAQSGNTIGGYMIHYELLT